MFDKPSFFSVRICTYSKRLATIRDLSTGNIVNTHTHIYTCVELQVLYKNTYYVQCLLHHILHIFKI